MWLRDLIGVCGASPAASLQGVGATIPLHALARASLLGDRVESLRGRSVVLAMRDQLTAALALIELDGIAGRMMLCPPDLSSSHMPAVLAAAEADIWLGDSIQPGGAEVGGSPLREPAPGVEQLIVSGPVLRHPGVARRYSHATEWVLLSSGTTGVPKLIVHTLSSLCAALKDPCCGPRDLVWGTFYDIRRYGGLQILLRALCSGSLVLSSAQESTADFLGRAAQAGVSHISGTPSHWRAALMSGAAASIAPVYVRLSGEISDQGILNSLRAAYPRARIVHAFASTEAGVAFEVDDGRAGFPASLLGSAGPATDVGVEIKIADETLRLRSAGNAQRHLGPAAAPLADSDGFVNTGDRVVLRDGRYYFVGRTGGIINVGGLKVHPEEVEGVINSHPGVRISRVAARRSPITGAVVIAEVVPVDALAARGAEVLAHEIMELCREALPAHKVPAMIRIVERLEMSAAGKLVRADA